MASHRPSLERSATDTVLRSRMSLTLRDSAAVAPDVAALLVGNVGFIPWALTSVGQTRTARARTTDRRRFICIRLGGRTGSKFVSPRVSRQTGVPSLGHPKN